MSKDWMAEVFFQNLWLETNSEYNDTEFGDATENSKVCVITLNFSLRHKYRKERKGKLRQIKIKKDKLTIIRILPIKVLYISFESSNAFGVARWFNTKLADLGPHDSQG